MDIVEALRSFWLALQGAQPALQAAVVAATGSLFLGAANIAVQVRQARQQRRFEVEQRVGQERFEKEQREASQQRQLELDKELERFRKEHESRVRWQEKRRGRAFEKLERVRQGLATAVSSFERLAAASSSLSDHDMVERASGALLSLGQFLSALSDARSDIAQEFLPICEEARSRFTETFLALSVDLAERQSRQSEIQKLVSLLVERHATFEELFKKYERRPWDWDPEPANEPVS
jgi:hypothetical protein